MSEAALTNSEKFPFPLTDVDRHNLTLKDSEFKPHTWEELRQIIADNKLEILRRWPSDLKRYMKWSAQTKEQYGTIMNFVMTQRLKWSPSQHSTLESGPLFDYKSPVPFADENDYKIMPNDWPYGLDQGITHLIVWLKHRLPIQPPLGDMTNETRQMVENFVQKKFKDPLKEKPESKEKVMWFKNWVALQSVPGIDHIHILVRDVSQHMIDDFWTHGQKPLQDLVTVK